MAPKTLYNAAEVQQKVTETAEKAFKTLNEEGWEFSACQWNILLSLTGKIPPLIGRLPVSGAFSITDR